MSFDRWLNDLTEHLQKQDDPIEQELQELLRDHPDVDADLIDQNDGYPIAEWEYPCRCCGENGSINRDPWEFDPEMHYCGRNQWCIP